MEICQRRASRKAKPGRRFGQGFNSFSLLFCLDSDSDSDSEILTFRRERRVRAGRDRSSAYGPEEEGGRDHPVGRARQDDVPVLHVSTLSEPASDLLDHAQES